MAADPRRKSGLSHLLHYSSSTVFRQLLGVVGAFLRPRLLSHRAFGIWSLLALVPLYTVYLHLGAGSATRLRLAALARHDPEAATIRTTGRLGFLVPCVLLALALLAAALLLDHADSQVRIGLVLSAVIVLLSWWLNNEQIFLKTELRFHLISRATYLQGVLLLVFTVALLPLWGLTGALLAVIFTLVLVCLFLKRQQPRRRYGRFDWHCYGELIRAGFPLLGMDIIVLLIRTTDRLVIASFMGTSSVALYVIGGMITSFLINIPGSARETIEPRMMRDYSRIAYASFIDRYFSRVLFNTALLFPLLLAGGWIVLPLFLAVILPGYDAALLPARILFLGSYFLALYLPLRGLIFAHGWQWAAFFRAMGIFFLNLTGSILASWQGLGLTGVAGVSAFSFFLLFTTEIMADVRHIRQHIALGWGPRGWLGLAAFPVTLFLLLLLGRLISPVRFGPWGAVGIQLLFFYLIWIVILVWGWQPLRLRARAEMTPC